MKEQPLVSIIAACYNQARYAKETLDSIKAQTYKNIELIIWDDCSTDNSVEVIENWIRENDVNCVFLKHTRNMGICKSLNDAFSHVKGKYLQITAVDDVLLPDKIEKQVEALEQSKDKEALVFSDALLMNERSELFQNKFIARHRRYLSLESGCFFEDLLDGNFIPCMTVLYKTSCLHEVGAWDENLIYEDYDMLLRLASAYEFVFMAEPTVKYRIHDSNFHKKYENLNEEMVKSQFLIYLKYENEPVAKQQLIDILLGMYSESFPNMNYYADLYFQKHAADSFLLKCIKKKRTYTHYLLLKNIRILLRKVDVRQLKNRVENRA